MDTIQARSNRHHPHNRVIEDRAKTRMTLFYAIVYVFPVQVIFPFMTHGTIIFPIMYYLSYYDKLFFIISPKIFHYGIMSAPG